MGICSSRELSCRRRPLRPKRFLNDNIINTNINLFYLICTKKDIYKNTIRRVKVNSVIKECLNDSNFANRTKFIFLHKPEPVWQTWGERLGLTGGALSLLTLDPQHLSKDKKKGSRSVNERYYCWCCGPSCLLQRGNPFRMIEINFHFMLCYL